MHEHWTAPAAFATGCLQSSISPCPVLSHWRKKHAPVASLNRSVRLPIEIFDAANANQRADLRHLGSCGET